VFGRFTAVAVVGLIALAGAACQTFESGAVWRLTLRNDTRTPAVVRACTSSACTRFRYVRRVMAGRAMDATDRGDGRSWWLVSSFSGKRLGCLSLDYTHRVDGYVIRLSRATTCPG
jgi:hypothetical protein